MFGFGWIPEGEPPEYEIQERNWPHYYVLLMRMRGVEGEWLRLEWRSDYFPTSGDSLVCHLDEWR